MRNKIRLAIAAAAVAVIPVAAAVAADVTPASAMQGCYAQRVTYQFSDAFCYNQDGPIYSTQAWAVCIWPGQPNGIRQTVRGVPVYSHGATSYATCPTGKQVYSWGAYLTYW